MTVSLASFRVRYPEFSAAADALAQAVLDEANVTVRGDEADAVREPAVYCLAAYLLSESPGGRALRVVPQSTSEKSTAASGYERAWLRYRSVLGLDAVVSS